MTRAFVVGATGEVGRCLLRHLAESPEFTRIVIISRHRDEYNGPNRDKLLWEVVPDFDDLDAHREIFKDCQAGFCTLGSTKAKAGSAEAFEKIDYGYTMKIASLAKAAGCQWFGVVTSVGANINSNFLYPRVKGMIERDLIALGFPCLEIFRPGFLICDRKESRPFEALGLVFARAFNWLLPNRVAIETDLVGQAMVKKSKLWLEKKPADTVFCIYENAEIAKIVHTE